MPCGSRAASYGPLDSKALIATGDGGGGYRDVEDGDLREHFAGRT
jgi:hypothetical protein